MPTPQLGSLNPNATLDELKDYLVGLNRYLNYLLSSLDTLNISRLDAKVIIAGSIIAGKLAADSVETDNLQAGAVTADKITVSQLSAITADMGILTAGIIYGAYIATANGTYPRIELSSVGNLLGAFLDATHSLRIEPDVGGAPGIGFYDPTGLVGRIYGNSGLGMLALINDIELTSLSGNVSATSAAGTIVDIVASINSLNSSIGSLNSSISSLTSALSGKANSGGSTSSTSVSDGHNHGIPNGTLLAVSGGGSVTWSSYAGSAGHSHTI